MRLETTVRCLLFYRHGCRTRYSDRRRARQVIDALQLQGDPVLAMVEIDNETSLLQAWQTNGFDPYVIGDYRAQFQQQWNSYLSAAYRTTGALRAAWASGDPDGPELLSGNRNLEIHSPSQATLSMMSDGTARLSRTDVLYSHC